MSRSQSEEWRHFWRTWTPDSIRTHVLKELTDEFTPVLPDLRCCSNRLEGSTCNANLQERETVWPCKLQAGLPYKHCVQAPGAHHRQSSGKNTSETTASWMTTSAVSKGGDHARPGSWSLWKNWQPAGLGEWQVDRCPHIGLLEGLRPCQSQPAAPQAPVLQCPGYNWCMDLQLPLWQGPSSGGGWISILFCQRQIRSPSVHSAKALLIPRVHKRPAWEADRTSKTVCRWCISIQDDLQRLGEELGHGVSSSQMPDSPNHQEQEPSMPLLWTARPHPW